MDLMRTVISVTALALAGCAATPKPAMQELEYRNFASGWVTLQKCGQSGMMDPATASLGVGYMKGLLANYTFDASRLESSIGAAARSVNPSAASCNSAAMDTYARQRQINQHNAMVAQDQKAWADMINSNKPVRANCHQIGSQTVCDSY